MPPHRELMTMYQQNSQDAWSGRSPLLLLWQESDRICRLPVARYAPLMTFILGTAAWRLLRSPGRSPDRHPLIPASTGLIPSAARVITMCGEQNRSDRSDSELTPARLGSDRDAFGNPSRDTKCAVALGVGRTPVLILGQQLLGDLQRTQHEQLRFAEVGLLLARRIRQQRQLAGRM